MYKILNREEMCKLLNVSNEGLKSIIKRKNLEKRVNELGLGYKFIESYKEGRKVYYKLEEIKEDVWKQCQKFYDIEKVDEHTKYSYFRLRCDLAESRSSIIKNRNIDISPTTAKRYDDILLNEKAMEENGMVYYYIDTTTDEMTEITKLEYDNYWKDNRVASMAINNVNKKKAKNEISESFADYSKYSIIRELGNKEGTIAIKFMTYKEAENSKMFLDMIKESILANKKN